MIYPDNFEQKIGFHEVRALLKGHCISILGKEMVDAINFSTDCDHINELMNQTREFRRLMAQNVEFPMKYFFDVREPLKRIHIVGTHLETEELFDLRRSMETINDIVAFFNKQDDDNEQPDFPSLKRLTDDIRIFPDIVRRIDQILDKFGRIKDSASSELQSIRRELTKTENSISRTLYNILHTAQSSGLVEKDVTPTLRDGRLVIPVAPALKRRISGIVHDESATGKTVYIEPTEVVEANNRIRELENEERREIIRILTELTNEIRPKAEDIIYSFHILSDIDFIHAKAMMAEAMEAFEPTVEDTAQIDFIRAIHPLLRTSLERQGKQVVPLDITLHNEQRIIVISGPNAGGKSVCLKTVGLLQYMIQCGLPVSIGDRSSTGIFKDIMIDIGDEQSIEDDLSTYSSHLQNMKQMMRNGSNKSLLLIDEFGTGTEPQIGGAIAEAVLKQFWKKKMFGVITTHYQNLKHFADDHKGVVNGAMLYDRHEMRPLFQLSIGRPGSSFAIEIARKTGLPEEVIADASEIVGSDYIQSDKYLQDIVRDKRYWEGKRQTIHQREKDIERTIEHYETSLSDIEHSRKEILRRAKEQAEELLNETNRRIENAIREIRESQAEKEETKRIREELNTLRAEVSEIDTRATDEMIEKKMAQIQARKERKQKRKERKRAEAEQAAADGGKPNSANIAKKDEKPAFNIGDTVRIKGLTSIGRLEQIDGKMAVVVFGDMRTRMPLERLVHSDKPLEAPTTSTTISRMTRETIDERRKNFHQDLDVRGMRGDETLNAVQYFIDDATLVGMSRVRILHGKGNGILRQLIRQYLATLPNVRAFADEHVQFGGSGITVVDL